MKNKAVLFLICILAAASTRAKAGGYYVGASLLDTESELMGISDGDSGWEARIGYTFNDYLAVEADYLDLGDWQISNIEDAGGSIKNDAYGVSVLGSYPMNDFSVTGKLGNLWWERDGWLGSISGPMDFNDDGFDLLWGLGGAYRINDNIELKIEYNDSGDFDWSALGLNYRF